MPTIAFVSPKGGSGKSTAAVILGTELARRGHQVSIIDADPRKAVMRWAKNGKQPETLVAIGDNVTEATILDLIGEAQRRSVFVIIDVEGSANMIVGYAMSRADLVVIPTKGSYLDATAAITAIKFVRRQEQAYGRDIPFSILITQTSPAVRSRTLKGIEGDFAQEGVPVFKAALHERDAFRALFSYGGTLATLDPKKVSGLQAASANAHAYVTEVVAKLGARSLKARVKQGAVEQRV